MPDIDARPSPNSVSPVSLVDAEIERISQRHESIANSVARLESLSLRLTGAVPPFNPEKPSDEPGQGIPAKLSLVDFRAYNLAVRLDQLIDHLGTL